MPSSSRPTRHPAWQRPCPSAPLDTLSRPHGVAFRDFYFVQKLVGLRADDGFAVNQVLICVFNIMGVWPLIYAQLLFPSGRRQGQHRCCFR
eukprot:SM000176S03118  [mRNA]  locus=s176:9925:10253:+ [translate_table: standard]